MRHVEDEGDRAVAENGGAGEARHVGVQLGQRLDHRLVAADDLVDDQADARVGRRDDDDLLMRVGLAGFVEQFAQAQERHQLAANVEEAAPLRAGGVGLGKFDAFLDRGQRNGVARVGDADQQAFDDRQRQRQAQGDLRPLAGLGGEVDRTAHALDRALDDVQADAAARQRRDLLGGREPGLEDQLMQLGVG